MNSKTISENTPNLRRIGRRKSDFILSSQISRLYKLKQVGQVITCTQNRDDLFEILMAQINQIMETERCTVFVLDEKDEMLWSFVVMGMKKETIRISINDGITGWVFQNRRTLKINNPQIDFSFYKEIDRRPGFKTKNILCIPMIDRNDNCIGVLQVLNKKQGEFDKKDTELLYFLSHYVTIALEKAKLHEEIKELSKVKERAINHLSRAKNASFYFDNRS